MNNEETISAISTPIGEGGIGIVRLSGPDAISIVEGIFKNNNKKGLKDIPSYTIHYGKIFNPTTNETIDEAILSIMRAPKSYTREDVVEINCHGGIIPLRKTLELVLSLGARLAEPGEFTKRAFLNGRLDLSQAEAVIDIIKAKTELSLKMSMEQLKGGLSKKIQEISTQVKELLAFLEAEIDFSDDEIEELGLEEKTNRIKSIIKELDALIDTSDYGKIIKDGINVVIVGKPNVGKSSLLNILLKEERAIVTEIPGTTRDVIEEVISINGVPIKLTDTAGIRETNDIVEMEGVKRSKNKLSMADLVLLVLDGSNDLTEEDFAIINEVKNKKVIIVINKIDLKLSVNMDSIEGLKFSKAIKISALNETGIDDLKNAINEEVFSGNVLVSDGGVIVTNLRHKNALENTKKALDSSLKAIKENMSNEFICVDLKASLDFLGEIIGKTTPDDILNIIFSRFCIGK